MIRSLTAEEAEHAPFRGADGIRVAGVQPNDFGVDLVVEVTPCRALRVTAFSGFGALITCPNNPGEGIFVRFDAAPEVAGWMDAWFAWQSEDEVAEAEQLLGMDLGSREDAPPPPITLTGASMLWEEATLNGFPEDAARLVLGECIDGSTAVVMAGVSYA